MKKTFLIFLLILLLLSSVSAKDVREIKVLNVVYLSNGDSKIEDELLDSIETQSIKTTSFYMMNT